MGILSNLKTLSSNLKSRYESRKQKRKNDKEINKVLKELKILDSDSSIGNETKNLKKQRLITSFALQVKKGNVKFNDGNVGEPLGIVENVLESEYPQIREIGKEIRFSQMFNEIKDEMSKCLYSLKIHKEVYQKIEKLALEFYKKYPDDTKRNLSIKPLTNFEIHNIICSYFEKGCTDSAFLEDVLKRMRTFTVNKVIEEIVENGDVKEQERMYNEYVNDFLAGIEEKEDNVVRYFEDSEFIQKRNRRKKCEKYEVKYDDEPLIIYEAEESKLKDLDEENRKRAEARLQETTTVSDLVLVRTTNVFPKNGVVETLDKHSMPELQDSFFKKEIRAQNLDTKEFELYSFVNRRSSHWTLNALVSSHMYGNFDGRNFILIEPFEKQIANNGLTSIDESDTYFIGDLKLSDKAIVLMKLEEYKKRYEDPIKREEMKKMNIRLFVGDEKIAVKMLLQELGYVYEEVGTWGYDLDTNTPELKYARKLEMVMDEETKRLQQEGKEIDPTRHFDSRSNGLDNIRMKELELERIDRFVNMLAENSDVKFSPKYLKRIFINRASFKEDDDDHYLDRDIVEPEGLIRMSAKEVFDRIGLDKIKGITQKFNEMMLEEHRIARKQKDEELVKKGLVPKEVVVAQELVE